jgi:hypothetical protein
VAGRTGLALEQRLGGCGVGGEGGLQAQCSPQGEQWDQDFLHDDYFLKAIESRA